MPIPIVLKGSDEPNKRPNLSDLQLKELAINTNSAHLYARRDSGGVGIGTTVSLLTPWIENFGGQSIYYGNSVGIGTTNPESKFTVQNGDIRVGVNTSHGLILTDENGVSWRIGISTDGTLITTSI